MRKRSGAVSERAGIGRSDPAPWLWRGRAIEAFITAGAIDRALASLRERSPSVRRQRPHRTTAATDIQRATLACASSSIGTAIATNGSGCGSAEGVVRWTTPELLADALGATLK